MFSPVWFHYLNRAPQRRKHGAENRRSRILARLVLLEGNADSVQLMRRPAGVEEREHELRLAVEALA